MSGACGARPIDTLTLQWKGTDMPRPAPSVAQALAQVPIAFGLRDVRPDPTMVGLQEDGNTVIKTPDNVAQYASARMGEMLRSAGARMDETAVAVIETDLAEYKVVEGGRFNGIVALRVTVRRGGSADWSKSYEGASKRWGRSHNPENFNEALSNALADATGKMFNDHAFASALMAGQAPPASAPPENGPPGAPPAGG